ncbi:MAG: RrF2 family transcriptional regulator [Armatimonadota bacterium]
MAFTSKEEYGLRALMHLASKEAAWPIQSREIASSEEIPEQFLEQVLGSLRRAGIVGSIRGASGGYELARPAAKISAGDVIRALSGPISSGEERRGRAERCTVLRLSQRVQQATEKILDGTSVQDLLDESRKLDRESGFMMNI